MRPLLKLLASALIVIGLHAQQQPPAAPSQALPPAIQPEVSGTQAAAAPVSPAAPSVRPNYVLGPNDQVLIKVPEAEEFADRPFRIDSDGMMTLPLVGAVKAGGLTVEQFEAELTKQLTTYIRTPHVSVSVAQYRSDPVFLTGAFQRPGIYSLAGQRTLLEILTTASGLQPNASRRIRITRRLDQGKIPLPTAIEDPDNRVSTVEISLSRLMEVTNSAENITLQPFDVLYVARAEMVFLTVQGGKAGGFPLDDREYISVLQVLSLAGGLGPNVRPEKARILRPVLDTARRVEIPVNVKAILEGKANDYPLMPNDVLMIPSGSAMKGYMVRPLTFALPALITNVIWVALR